MSEDVVFSKEVLGYIDLALENFNKNATDNEKIEFQTRIAEDFSNIASDLYSSAQARFGFSSDAILHCVNVPVLFGKIFALDDSLKLLNIEKCAQSYVNIFRVLFGGETLGAITTVQTIITGYPDVFGIYTDTLLGAELILSTRLPSYSPLKNEEKFSWLRPANEQNTEKSSSSSNGGSGCVVFLAIPVVGILSLVIYFVV